ncbi:PIH1 domain-containing protein 1-like isoform X1 [Dreissena polymorpha]|uniref:PIH1 domain-containing protein 1-like isoform X1 n=1 Tax=Dreissena polymorpha TaxID=45954 RepID=UPI0022655DF2|nr:PIH1 domain-containing protein 1-like isoform X1 [Dreissena polymorpha]
MDVYHPDRSLEDREATLNTLLMNAACGRVLRGEHRVPGENPTCPTEDPGLRSALNQSIPTTQVTPKPAIMDPSLLDSNLEVREAMLNQLLMNAATEDPGLLSALNQSIPTTQVTPKPGFCIKTKNSNKEKVFINICTAENVPAPKEMSDEDLIKLLESEDPTGYRIPMSIGEPHAEMDKAGGGCTAYDVVVSPEFMQKMGASELFRTFFLTVMMEGLESKYDIQLSREWIILKNRKFVGTLQVQNVRTKSKPFIMEMDKQNGETPNKPGRLIQEVTSSAEDIKSKGKEPDYRIVQEPPEGHPEFLVAEINLPNVKVCSSISLDLGEDRILLQTRSNTYYLDIYIPFFIVQADCGAQFNRKTRILTITMPVQPLT